MAKRIELSKEQEEWIYSELQTKTYKQIVPELKEVYGIEIRYDSLRHYMERHGYRSPRNGRFSKGHESLAARSKAQALVWRTMEEYIGFELDDIKERLKSEETKDDETD